MSRYSRSRSLKRRNASTTLREMILSVPNSRRWRVSGAGAVDAAATRRSECAGARAARPDDVVALLRLRVQPRDLLGRLLRSQSITTAQRPGGSGRR